MPIISIVWWIKRENNQITTQFVFFFQPQMVGAIEINEERKKKISHNIQTKKNSTLTTAIKKFEKKEETKRND